jgi:2-haloacid dehalogenase
MASPRVVTFDFYGTMVQWHQALEAAARDILTRKGVPAGQAPSLLRCFHEAGRALRDSPPMRSYRSVLRMSLAAALAEHGQTYDAEDAALLMDRVSRIPAFPEVPEVLNRLRKTYRLGIISNTDDDIIKGSLETLGTTIDYVVTAQQAGAYKPNLRLFRYAHEQMGVKPDQIVHVAASQALDMQVCAAMGIRAIWVNRRDEQPDPRWRPSLIVTDLAQLPELIHSL